MATTFTVPDGRVAMAAVTRNGFGTSGGSITSLLFQPDYIWEKTRSIVDNNVAVDSVRGVTKYLVQNNTSAEGTNANYFQSFNSNGYTLGSSDYATGVTVVDWCWKAGGTAVSNTAGTITSSVSANTTAGFSVVTYTGNGTNGATVGHGLGAKPSLIIEKGRSTAYNWSVQGCGVLWTPATSNLFLNATNALNASGAVAAPTTSVFTPSVTNYANESGVSNVAYCWAPIAGYSAFGSYTGNGSADGPFIYTGFRPRWIMIKRTDAIQSWAIWDTSRDSVNVVSLQLYPNLSSAENSYLTMDIVSNGFKSRSATEYNTSSGTYIYAAFAENPLKYANAR